MKPRANKPGANEQARSIARAAPARIVDPGPPRALKPTEISDAAPRVALRSAGSPTGAPALAGTAQSWKDAVRAAVPTTGPDFATFLRALSSESPWEFADTPELVGLERWGRELAQRDRIAGIGALVVAARHGFPIASAAGGDQLEGMGFRGTEADPIVDGASVEIQIARALAWLDDPGPATLEKVNQAFDRGRQLHVWDDDLRPAEDSTFYWYLDAGQCCCAAILDAGNDPDGETYYEWPTPTCVGRGLVLAARGLRGPKASTVAVVNGLHAAMVG